MQQKERLFFLFQRYVDRELTHEEQTELKEMTAHDKHLEETFRQLLYLHTKETDRIGSQVINKEKAWRRISRKTANMPFLRSWRWTAVAAGFVALVASATFLCTRFFTEDGNDYTEKAIARNTDSSASDTLGHANMYTLQVINKAILTTSDGGMVRLTGHNKSNITTTDGQVIGRNIGDRLVYTKPIPQSMTCNIRVPEGSTYRLSLYDGTSITLNSGSELTYTIGGETVRDVKLRGEAFFEVVHNDDQHFVVECNDGTLIRDIGTKFNVSAYDGQDMTVTVSEGVVELPQHNKLLSAGSQWTKTRTGRQSTCQVNPDPYVSWVSGIYDFKDVEMADILSQLSIWYNVKLHYDVAALRHVKFTGTVFKYERLGYTLDLLQRVADVRFTLRDGTVFVGDNTDK